jgi:hypothetical protein
MQLADFLDRDSSLVQLSVAHIGASGPGGIAGLVGALARNRHLLVLDVRANIGSAAAVPAINRKDDDGDGDDAAAASALNRALTSVLPANHTLEALLLAHNPLGSAAQVRQDNNSLAALSAAIAANRSLTLLDLSHTSMGDEGGVVLARALLSSGSSSKLNTLRLSYNAIGDSAAEALGQCLRAHPTMAGHTCALPVGELMLDHNRIGPKGAELLITAVLGDQNSDESILSGKSDFGQNQSLRILHLAHNIVPHPLRKKLQLKVKEHAKHNLNVRWW